jgi:hypothetical protein
MGLVSHIVLAKLRTRCDILNHFRILPQSVQTLCYGPQRQKPLSGLSNVVCGPYRIRTCDPLIANEMLYQLS